MEGFEDFERAGEGLREVFGLMGFVILIGLYCGGHVEQRCEFEGA